MESLKIPSRLWGLSNRQSPLYPLCRSSQSGPWGTRHTLYVPGIEGIHVRPWHKRCGQAVYKKFFLSHPNVLSRLLNISLVMLSFSCFPVADHQRLMGISGFNGPIAGFSSLPSRRIHFTKSQSIFSRQPSAMLSWFYPHSRYRFTCLPQAEFFWYSP